MKKLILYDHQGMKLLEQDVFVEGQNFAWESPKPTAFWLGEIWLVDKEPEPELKLRVTQVVDAQELPRQRGEFVPKVEVVTASVVEVEIPEVKEEEVEPTEVDNQSAGDSRVSKTNELEGSEGLFEKPAGGEPSQRSKKPRKRKAA